MKGYYRLLNVELSVMLRAVLLLSLGTVITPLFLLRSAMYEPNTTHMIERFEDLYVSSGGMTAQFIFLAAFGAYFLKTIYASYWGSKSIYTYLTLPVRREMLYLSKLSAGILCLLLLLAAQLISMLISYQMFHSIVFNYSSGEHVMSNGLFLSFVRSEYVRLILPFSLKGAISTFAIIVTFVTGLYYGAICERSKRYWGYVVLFAAAILLFNVLTYRLSPPSELYSHKNLYLNSAVLLGLSGYFIWHSMRLIRRSAIA
ncbi:hypothetical protein [Paenibacillus marinisediminis]